MKKYMAIAGLIVVTVIWGGGFVASDMALDSLLPFQIMAIRFASGLCAHGRDQHPQPERCEKGKS